MPSRVLSSGWFNQEEEKNLEMDLDPTSDLASALNIS